MEPTLQLTDIIFYCFAVVVVASAAIVVFTRNIVYAAFSLLFTFFGVAGIYVLLAADFIAVTQLLVYVGGILVLILFGVMLTTRIVSVDIRSGAMQTLPATLMAGVLLGVLTYVFWSTEWNGTSQPAAPPLSTAPAIGRALITTYLLPFELASVVLLVAMMGAALIARREKKVS